MKIDRLLGITIYLLNHDKVSARTLSDRFEVSVRTIQRDIETLCETGIPVASSLGIDGGYEILDSFKMEKQIARTEDYSYIISALQGLASAYESNKINLTLEKMKAVLYKNNIDTNIILDFSVSRENENINKNLKVLESAVVEKRVVSFIYTNADNKTSKKEVEPIAVTYRWYAWYLLAYSSEQGEYRLYKLVRMRNLTSTDKKILREHEPASVLLKRNDENDNRKYIDIKLFCKAEVKTKAIEYLKGNIELEYENGDFIMNLHLPENEELWFGTLFSLGKLVKVIEPEALKEKLCDKSREILNLYHDL